MNRAPALRHVTADQPEVVVVACGLTRQQRTYVDDGLRLRADCRFVDTFDDLAAEMAALSRCDALVLPQQDPRGRSVLPILEVVARDWPGTAIVIILPPAAGNDSGSSIRSLFLAGAHDVVFDGVYNTAAALAQKVESARRECAAEVIFDRVQPLIPARLHSVVQAVLTRPDTLTSVGDVAAFEGVHRKTLVNRCAKCAFLQPAELIMWCRLAVVGQLLERTGSTVEAISTHLGFASHTALRNLLKRYTGHRATDIRRLGGLSVVLAALKARIDANGTGRLPIA